MTTPNTLRRLNWLWKHRHTHDDDDFQDQITVIERRVEEVKGGLGAAGSGAYVHLERAASQSIGTSLEAIEWDQLNAVFTPLEFSVSPPVTEVEIRKPGYYDIEVSFAFDSAYNGGGSVTVVRTSSEGGETTVWPPTVDADLWVSSSGRRFEGVAKGVGLKTGDTISIYVEHNDGSAVDLDWAACSLELVDRVNTNRPEGFIRAFSEVLNDTESTDHPITLPDDILEGDPIILVFHGTDIDENAVTVTLPSGFTELTNVVVEPSTDAERAVTAYKIADGTEGGTTITTTTNVGATSASVAIVVGGATGTAPEASAATGTTSNTPNPPEETHSSSEPSYLTIAAYTTDGPNTATSRSTSAIPAGYSLIQTIASDLGSTDGATIGTAWKTGFLPTEDPGTFTFTEDSDQWSAHTIMIPCIKS